MKRVESWSFESLSKNHFDPEKKHGEMLQRGTSSTGLTDGHDRPRSMS